jgi:hypothetical protein
LNKPETEVIVRRKRGSKTNRKGKVDDYYLRRALARLPSASSAARRLLLLLAMILRFALIEERKLEAGKDLKAKGLVKAGGTYGFIYRPGEADRGLRSWPWVMARIPKNLEGGEVSLTNPSSGRLESKAESYSVDWLG